MNERPTVDTPLLGSGIKRKADPATCRRRSLALTITALAVSFSAVLCLLRPFNTAPFSALSGGGFHEPGSEKDTKEQGSSTAEVTGVLTASSDVNEEAPKGDKTVKMLVTQNDMIESTAMRNYMQSLSLEDHEFFSRNYLPQRITIEYTLKNVEGDVGPDALNLGKVAFSLQHRNTNGTDNRAYNIVMNMNGTIASISPQLYYVEDSFPTSLKFYSEDPSYVVLGMKSNGKLDGPVYLWNWDDSKPGSAHRYINLTTPDAGIDAHDVSIDGNGDCFLWGITTEGIALFDRTGAFKDCGYYRSASLSGDINHAQVYRNKSLALISDRGASSIVILNLSADTNGTRGTDIVIGGSDGNVSLIDENGIVYDAGTELWVKQHNAEYFGGNEVYMYDNHVVSSRNDVFQNNSRALIIKLEEEKGAARIVWSYDMGFFTPVFGDVDRVVNNHIQICGWVYSTEIDYDMTIREVDRASQEIAWELKVFNQDTTEKYITKDAGWNIYSAERIYDRPLVYGTECTQEGTTGISVSFWTLNRFKENDGSNGYLSVYNSTGAELGSQIFEFAPFFQDNFVKQHVAGLVCSGSYLHVKNVWGDTTRVSLG